MLLDLLRKVMLKFQNSSLARYYLLCRDSRVHHYGWLLLQLLLLIVLLILFFLLIHPALWCRVLLDYPGLS